MRSSKLKLHRQILEETRTHPALPHCHPYVMSMENDVSLLVCAYSSSYGCVPVPLHVKLKIGSTWGSLEPFQASE
ncbi:hypothetical protein KY285_033443 [Solanum tuberosum]|nr:hypothetical protein KY285_033440 [Solanum tuberosum]KAH0648195.1 hypothetical protein KY285_033443 [Solanum tuberosum]